MPGVYVGVGCSFVKANKVFVGVGCSFVEATKVYTAENCNWKVIHEAGGKGLIALVGPGGTTGINPDVNWSSYRSIVALSDDTVAFAVTVYTKSMPAILNASPSCGAEFKPSIIKLLPV